MDDDRYLRHALARDTALRMAFSPRVAASIAPDRLCIFRSSSGPVLCGHDQPPLSPVGCPHILRMALGVQSVRRVDVLERHGRSLYPCAGGQTLRCDCRRRKYRCDGRSASHDRFDLFPPHPCAAARLGRISRRLWALSVSTGSMGEVATLWTDQSTGRAHWREYLGWSATGALVTLPFEYLPLSVLPHDDRDILISGTDEARK